MPLLADRVKESTTTQGTGTLTLAGAPPGFRTFTGAFGNGASVYYVIAGPTEWEIGFGTTGAGTLTRDTVLVSSAGGTTKVNLSAGPKDVFCSYVADRAVTTSDAATLTNKTIDDYTNDVGANSTHFRIKAGATLAKGDVVKASGFTPGEQAIEVVKTASATDVAIGIVEQALSTGQFGMAVVIGELFDVNTNGLSVGATLYQNGAGGYTTTKPSSGFYQALGWVVRANTNNGVIAVNVVTPLYVETSTNTANTSVLRDGSGNFAAGTITASLTGNASTATALQTARTINGVSFNGTADITVTAAAGTLSGNTLASGVTASSLTSVGTLSSLTVAAKVSANNVGTAVSGFSDYLNGGAWDILGASTAGSASTLAIGGYRSSQWIGIDFYTGGVSRALIDNTGNLAVDTNTLFVDAVNNRVGVGTTSPGATAHIVDPAATLSGTVWFGSNAAFQGRITYDGTTNGQFIFQNRYDSANIESGFLFQTRTAGTPVDVMKITGTGNLGLGVTPSAWSGVGSVLEMKGGGYIGSATNLMVMTANTFFNGVNFIYKTSSQASRYEQFNGAHAWYTAASGTAADPITFRESARVDHTTTAGQTALLLWDVDNNTLERVTVGAADSGGTGFKVLRIPN